MHSKLQGKITFEKLKQVARSVGESFTDAELQEMISAADVDGNTSLYYWKISIWQFWIMTSIAQKKFWEIVSYIYCRWWAAKQRWICGFDEVHPVLNHNVFVKEDHRWCLHVCTTIVSMIIILLSIDKKVILVNSKYFANFMGVACTVF